MKNLLCLLVALCAFALPSFAGTGTFSPGQTSLTLDTPPPGATGIEVRFTSTSTVMSFGYENLAVGGVIEGITSTHRMTLNVGGTYVMAATPFSTETFAAWGYDGTTDYAGLSGLSWQHTVGTGFTTWGAYSGLPTTLGLNRRGEVTTIATGGVNATTYSNSSTANVEWRWI